MVVRAMVVGSVRGCARVCVLVFDVIYAYCVCISTSFLTYICFLVHTLQWIAI